MANFKEGRDWTQPGAPTLTDHYFIAKGGNDATLTPQDPDTPYETLLGFLSQPLPGAIGIVGTGKYSATTLPVSATKDGIKADGLVIIEGAGAGDSMLTGPFFDLTGFTIRNYGDFISGSGFSAGDFTMADCMLVDVNWDDRIGYADLKISNTVFVNSPFTRGDRNASSITFENCIFINSPLFCERDFTITGCVFDENSPVTGEPTTTITVNYTNYNSSITGGTVIIGPGNQEGIDPGFNNVVGFDFTIQRSSPLFGAGESGSNIGNAIVADPYFEGVELLDTAIDANPNVSYNGLAEIELQPGAANVEIIETDWVSRGNIGTLGAVRIAGILDLDGGNVPDFDNSLTLPNSLILEIATERNGLGDPIYLPYRWNETPTKNSDGTPNGVQAGVNPGEYNWGDNQFVPYLEVRYRISLRSDYTPS